MPTDVDKVNAILSALNSVKDDVNPTCGEILLASTEMIRQTLAQMPDLSVRDTLIAGIATALKMDDTSVLAAVWGDTSKGWP